MKLKPLEVLGRHCAGRNRKNSGGTGHSLYLRSKAGGGSNLEAIGSGAPKKNKYEKKKGREKGAQISSPQRKDPDIYCL